MGFFFEQNTDWRVRTPGMFERVPEIGIDGQPVQNDDPLDPRVMRRFINGKAQYRRLTDAEREDDFEQWARGVF